MDDNTKEQCDGRMLKHMLRGGVLFGYHMAKVGDMVGLYRGESQTHTFERGALAWDMVQKLITPAKWQELRQDFVKDE